MKLFVVLSVLMIAVSVHAGWFDDTKDWLGGAVQTVGEIAEKTKDSVVEKSSSAVDWTKDAGVKVGGFAKNVTLDDIVNGVKTAGNKVGETASGAYNHVASKMQETDAPTTEYPRK